MITPLTLVIDIDSLLAFPRRFDHRAVSIHDRMIKERVGLLPPDTLTNRIERFHQPEQLGRIEAAAEVTGGRRIGDALHAQGVQVIRDCRRSSRWSKQVPPATML